MKKNLTGVNGVLPGRGKLNHGWTRMDTDEKSQISKLKSQENPKQQTSRSKLQGNITQQILMRELR
jgi:hypothetical protein